MALLAGTLLTLHWMSVVVSGADQLLPCRDDQVKYSLTQCDEANGMWRVAVPFNSSYHCNPKGVTPLRVNSCEYVCAAGHSYDLETLSCTQCAAGTFSVGNSQIYDDWSVLPVEFTARGTPLVRSSQNGHPLNSYCSDQTWVARGDYVSLHETENCISRLSLDVDIVQQGGYVEFEYQYPDSSLLLVFNVIPAECNVETPSVNAGGTTDRNDAYRRFPERTAHGAWSVMQITLQQGKQKLVWMGVSMSTSQGGNYKPIRIRRVQISGVPYSKSCAQCPAGTFSSKGFVNCEECPLNHVSDKGAAVCKPCPDHQYALPGYLTCFDRKPCTAQDYLRRVEPCNEAHDSSMQYYEWISPKICLDVPQTVLPSTSKIPCPKCGHGTRRYNTTACSSCEAGQFVDSKGKCQTCETGSNPAYRYEITTWDYLPYSIDVSCWNTSAMGCALNGPAWQLDGGNINTGYGHEDDVVLLMQLFTGGFRKVIQQGIYGVLSFEFEMICISRECQMGFLLEDSDAFGNTIKTWTGTQPRQSFTYLIQQNTSLAFTWVFTKINTTATTDVKTTKSRRFGHDVLRIFSVNLTNTIDGGADSCDTCVGSDTACLRCQPNEIWNSELKKCQSCPANSVISDIDGTCKACGANLIADGMSCVSNCKASLQDGKKHYDLAGLQGFHQARTQRLFQAGGEEYFHLYNISFCQPNPAACTNTLKRGSSNPTTAGSMSAEGFVCRSTFLAAAGDRNATTSVQSFASGRALTEVVDHLVNSKDNVAQIFSEIEKEFPDKLAPDFYYVFRSPIPTSKKCPLGRSTVITMRCSKNTTSMHDIRVPLACPDGTCDGCAYRLLWQTPLACPVCGPDDYKIVRGECTDGKQTVYYQSNPYCHEVNSSTALMKQVPCRSVPYSVQVVLVILMLSALVLIVVILVLYQNASKYKHRYMKLVQDASGVVHLQLPESCVDDHELDDENEEDDKDSQDVNVEFRTPSETVYAKVRKAVIRKKDLHKQRGNSRATVGFRESEENELLTE